MKFLCVLCVLCGFVVPALALDREAFTFTKYDLDVRVEPEQQRLAVRGRITLRNDSSSPQKSLALQVSSTLDWRAITLDHEPVQFDTHRYTSDIDHTGALTEAIVTLPHEIPVKGIVELDVGYEGIVPLDVTRLTRIGVPEDKAKHIDWDRIGRNFTAVRGIGYVAWYPIATEAASLSEGDSVEETVGRWKVKHAGTEMNVLFRSTSDQEIFFSGVRELATVVVDESVKKIGAFDLIPLGVNVPTFAMANYQSLPPKDFLKVEFLPGQQDAVEAYAEVAASADPPVGRRPRNLQILGLPDDNDSPFVTEGILLTAFMAPMTNEAELDIVYALARQVAASPRAWVQEGLAHYAQAQFVEEQKGRQAALDYLDAHRSVLLEREKSSPQKAERERSLIDAPDDLYLQTKSMYVWWMLSDMFGTTPRAFLLNYHASDDKDPAYLQRLLQEPGRRDLQWFFDDWVYHDRGLPDFRVASVFSSPIANGGFLVTIVIENLGNAGAEVPVTLQTETGELRRRLEVHGKSRASLRIETTSVPHEVTVNDGSVPESDISNNTFRIESTNH